MNITALRLQLTTAFPVKAFVHHIRLDRQEYHTDYENVKKRKFKLKRDAIEKEVQWNINLVNTSSFKNLGFVKNCLFSTFLSLA